MRSATICFNSDNSDEREEVAATCPGDGETSRILSARLANSSKVEVLLVGARINCTLVGGAVEIAA